MGFFSKTCAKTNLPVMARDARRPEFSKVVVLLPNGDKITGIYNGYGSIDEANGRIDGEKIYPGESVDLQDYNVYDDAKFVLEQFYAGETYDALGKSYSDPAQGWFVEDEQLDAWLAQGGFKTIADYRKVYYGQ